MVAPNRLILGLLKIGLTFFVDTLYHFGETEMHLGPKGHLQGDPNQNLKFVLAITLKICLSDPMLVKPKCV